MVFLLWLLLLLGNSASTAAGVKDPTDLRTDSLTHPLSIEGKSCNLEGDGSAQRDGLSITACDQCGIHKF